MKQLLKISGKFYKANLHTHTTISDGRWSPEKKKENFKKAGYSIVAFTDHDKYINHEELNDENFVAIAAFEAGINQNISGLDWNDVKTYHLNIYAKDPKNFKVLPKVEHKHDDINYINDYIKKANENGGLVCYNHPGWSLQTREEFTKLEGLFAMEIYNNGCELEDGNGYASQAYNEMLRNGQKIYCVATDDDHNAFDITSADNDSFGGYIMVNLNKLDYKNTIEALENGEFYSSTGAEFKNIYIENNILKVENSPCNRVFIITDNRKSYRKLSHDEFTKCEFELTGKEKFIRVVAVNKNGGRAMSNAYWRESDWD
ncbi:MAG: CehA/McbA family metallohydrolase [Oscillospiraceae bacterium]